MKLREIPIRYWIKAKLNSMPTDYTLSDRFYVDNTTSRIYSIFSKPFNVETNILAKFNAHINKKSIQYLGESNRELADVSVGFGAGNIYGTVTDTNMTPEFILMYKDTNMHVTFDFIHKFTLDLKIPDSEIPKYFSTDTGNLFLQLMYRIEKSDALKNNMYLCTTNILNKRKGYTLTDILQLKDFKTAYIDKDNTDDFILSEMGFIPLYMSPTFLDDSMDFDNGIYADDVKLAKDTTVLNMFYILEVFYQMHKLDGLVDSSLKTLLRLLLDNCKTKDEEFIDYFTVDCKTIRDRFYGLFSDDPITRISNFYEFIRDNKEEIKKLWIPFTFAQYVKYAQYIGYLEYRKNVRALCRDMEKLYALHIYKDTKEFTSWKDSSSSEDYKDLDKMFDEASASTPVSPLDCEDSTSEDSLVDKSKDASKVDRVKELRTLDILDKSSFSSTMGKYDIDVDTVNTSEEKSDVLKAGYNKLKESLGLITPTLIRQIKEIKVYNTGGKDTGKLKGKLDKKNLYRYRTDHRIFYDNNYKIKESDLAFGIILDVSGSMSGSGIKNGKLTMVLLHEVLTSLRINHEIITHTSHGKHNSIIKRYKLFNENKMSNVNKVYEILGIKAENGNCDSGALYFMQQELRRVRNKDKIVMMFSDGEPTECTGKELINQVEDMEKEGIRVIGIGINYPSIKNYYAHNANGKDIKDMVDIITQILKEYVLEKI